MFEKSSYPLPTEHSCPLPGKGRVICLPQGVPKSLDLPAAAHSVCFHRPWVLRRKKSGVSALLLITSASHTCSGTV